MNPPEQDDRIEYAIERLNMHLRDCGDVTMVYAPHVSDVLDELERLRSLQFSKDEWDILAGVCSFYLSERSTRYITPEEDAVITRVLRMVP